MLNKEFSVAVMVSDAKKSAAWYKEKLGFEVSVEDHWVTAWPKGSTAKLHLCEGDLEPGNTGVAYYSKDAAKTVADLTKKGVKFTMPYTKTEWGAMAQLKDPDGNLMWVLPDEP